MMLPTFDPARGKSNQAPTRIYSARDIASHTKLKYRQGGQTSQDELKRLDLKAQLQRAEDEHYAKVNKTVEMAKHLSNSFKQTEDDDEDDGDQRSARIRGDAPKKADDEAEAEDDETPQERKRRLLQEASRLDKDASDDDSAGSSSDSDGSSDSDDDDDEDEDDTAELLRELEKIKRERAEEKERQERQEREQAEREREAQAAAGNPLLDLGSDGKPKDFTVKRRWDDDVIFKNQARGIDDKPKKRFVNDTLRSDFHRKFMSKYVQ
ncbi:hypothetical protein DFQ27_009101 [Actinomortierella ambigua]|uniref:Cwf15/Cwc15 cell cycle control protein n=1 Tax=Actinomortierella ambigua TaxID=1343610 RepID=A0A9P6TX43_9FUNG|nr:hypothetical protein DFQ26_009572 [Actinomortierella ambigua]KAG0250991.1 hypothetical protein DFQ27_009101 [Actinomortierella ambigua]